MNERDIAYWAGYFDADGHVTGQIRKDRKREIVFKIGVTSSVLKIMEELKQSFGGSITAIHRRGDQWTEGSPVATKTTYQWIVGYKDGEKFIRSILPYLKIKRPQAESFLKARSTYNHGKGRVPEETWTARLNLLNCIRQLNRPGSPDLAF